MAFNNYLEDENDKPYFTTNSLAYYYDKMEGFAKAVEGSAKALNLTKEEVEKRITLYIEQNKNELDQRLAQWDGKLETFDSSVETLLTEWVDDGTLTPLIDGTLIDQRLAPVTAQLTGKVGDGVKAEPEDLSERALALMTGQGTINLLSVPQDKSVNASKLSDSVTQVSFDYVPVYEGNEYGYFTNGFNNEFLNSDTTGKQLQIDGAVTSTNLLTFTAGTIKDTAYTNANGELTVSMRLKVSARQSYTQRVFVIGNGTGANVFELCIGATGNLLFVPNAMNTGFVLALNQWYTITFTLSGAQLTVFVDGVKINTFTLTAPLNLNGTLMIGALQNAYANPFVGQLSNILVYNSLLSVDSILDFHTQLKNGNNDTIFYKKNNVWGKMKIPEPVELTMPIKTGRFMHMSCDDFINVFKDITVNAYPSIFGNSTLAFLKSMHDQYGMVFSGYCFFENPDKTFTLDQMPATYAAEFKANSHWLKFGFHGYSEGTDYRDLNITAATAKEHYDLIMGHLFRICGGSYSLDYVPRIHFYGSSLDKTIEWKKADAGINGLLYPEDVRNGYYLNADQRAYLEKNDRWYDAANSLHFFSTDIRLEYVSNAITTLNTRKNDLAYAKRMNDLVIFTHELFITEAVTKTKIEDCCKFAELNGYEFDYPMNRI